MYKTVYLYYHLPISVLFWQNFNGHSIGYQKYKLIYLGNKCTFVSIIGIKNVVFLL